MGGSHSNPGHAGLPLTIIEQGCSWVTGLLVGPLSCPRATGLLLGKLVHMALARSLGGQVCLLTMV